MPRCSHNDSRVLDTHNRIDGSVRRTRECRACGARWLDVEPAKVPIKPKPRNFRRKLALEQVYRALTETQTPNKKMAAELGVSHQCIQQIRSGAIWTDCFPEIPRKVGRRSCEKCRHWDQGECAIGFPDPLEEGPSFAGDCDLYEV